ncbi:MAG: cysteine-rich CWC family protein [Bacteroidota bacterium]
MSLHEEKFCPRCNAKFECKVGNISQCQCTTVQLSSKEQQFMADQYDDCLCAKCLEAMKREFKLQPLREAWLKVFEKPFSRKK